MAMSATTLDALLAAGATAEMIVAAVKAEAEADEARAAAKRAKAAEKKRRQRACVPVCPGDIEGHAGTDGDTPSLPPSPQTPQPPTHPRGDISTREGVSAKGPTSVEIARGFLAFWAAYPKRVGKDAASKAFAKAMRRITDPDPLAVILAGIERAMPGWDDPQFIPHPATWLNAGRWEDDAPETRQPRPARNERPDRFTAKQDNLDRSFRAAESVADFVAAHRTF